MKTVFSSRSLQALMLLSAITATGGTLAYGKGPQTAMAGKTSALTGSASLTAAPAIRLLSSAEKALDERRYTEAKAKYQQAQKEVFRGFHDDRVQCLIRMGQAEIALKLDEDPVAAAKALTACESLCTGAFGENSAEMARLQLLLAESLFEQKKLEKAALACNQALTIHKKLSPEGHGTGQALSLTAKIMSAKGLQKESTEVFSQALKILEAVPGADMLDYSTTLYASGLARLGSGDEAGGTAAIEKAKTLLDGAVSLNKTPDQKGLVHYRWADGVPECRQIYDSIYPLKYLLVNKLRVAVALVRSDEHLAAIVSLANCSREPMQVAVGPVVVEKTSPGDRTKMFYCDPGLIDMPLEEECVSNLTWRRRWLCHIQKSHRIPGYLKNGVLDADNFYGNNVFGIYGCWDGSLQNAPPVVTREQFFFETDRKSQSYNEVERFMARSTGGYRPALIEPGDARTGVVFFLRQRYDTARVRVMVGNAIVDFPFQAVSGR